MKFHERALHDHILSKLKPRVREEQTAHAVKGLAVDLLRLRVRLENLNQFSKGRS